MNINSSDKSLIVASTASIGAMLLDAGKITPSDAEKIIHLQKEKGLRFGDAAKELGLIKESDIQHILSQQFDFPYLQRADDTLAKEVIAAYQPYSKQVEALRILRSQLMLRWFEEGKKILPIVSPMRGEGRSYLLANLAVVFSQLGERTLLIDADFKNPIQHQLFKLQQNQGLSDFLAGRLDTSLVARISALRDLSILPAGTIPPNPAELIGRGLKNALQKLHADYDVILIDTPAFDQDVSSRMIAEICGGALLIARKDKTRVSDMDMLSQILRESGVSCVGAVINDFK